jgi:hypothetical protein
VAEDGVGAWWRGDGALLAFTCRPLDASATAGAAGNQWTREVRVYTPDLGSFVCGRHPADSLPLDPLVGNGAGAWAPDGSVFAVPQWIPPPRSRLQLALFESNGQRHREVALPYKPPSGALLQPPGQVAWLGWSLEGDVLALAVDVDTPTGPQRLLQLWHRDNYHWHCKREARFDAPRDSAASATAADQLLSCQWDPERPRRLHMLLQTRAGPAVLHWDLEWEFTLAPSGRAGGALSACVSEGAKVLLTPLALSQVPPPMAYATLALTKQAPSDGRDLPMVSEAAFAPGAFAAQEKAPEGGAGALTVATLGLLTSTGDVVVASLGFVPPREVPAPLALAKAAAGVTPVRVLAGAGTGPASPLRYDYAVSLGQASDCGVARCLGVPLAFQPAALSFPLAGSTASTVSPAAGSIRQLVWLEDTVPSSLLCAFVGRDPTRLGKDARADLIFFVRIRRQESEETEELEALAAFPLPYRSDAAIPRPAPTRVLRLFRASRASAADAPPAAAASVVVAHLNDGSVWGLPLSPSPTGIASESSAVQTCLAVYAEPCVALQVVYLTTGPLVFALSARGRLYANERAFVEGCSGFSLHMRHGLLLYATLGPSPTVAFASLVQLAVWAAPGAPQSTMVAAESAFGSKGADGAEAHSAGLRALERGARLLGPLSEDSDAVLLQIPRGNLETIVPRVFTLSSVRMLLDRCPPQWGEAVELMRQHRVDMNLFYDHRPASFARAWLTDGVPQVAACALRTCVGPAREQKKVHQTRGGDRWDLFLSALAPEDVTQTKYPRPSWYTVPEAQKEFDAVAAQNDPAVLQWAERLRAFDPTLTKCLDVTAASNKITRACALTRIALLRKMVFPAALQRTEDMPDAVLSVEDIDCRHPLVLSVLTSFARQSPADLESVLRVVQRAATAESSETKAGGAAATTEDRAGYDPIAAESVLTHAILVCDADVELLYATALGMYDVHLAHTLAQRGQQDPREYRPFLASLVRLSKASDAMLPALPGALLVAAGDDASGKLTVGQVQQRFAIDVHLGRWGRAVQGLSLLASADPTADPKERDREKLRIRDAVVQTASALVCYVPVGDNIGLESLISASLEAPLVAALAICHSYGCWKDMIAVAKAKDSPILTFIRKAAHVGNGWFIASGRKKPDAQGASSDPWGDIRAVGRLLRGELKFLPHIPSCLRTAVTRVNSDQFVDALFARISPGLNTDMMRRTPIKNIQEALSEFLTQASPVAVDEALALAIARGAEGDAADAIAFGKEYTLWRLALSLAAQPSSCVRRKRWTNAGVSSLIENPSEAIGLNTAMQSPPTIAQLAQWLASAFQSSSSMASKIAAATLLCGIVNDADEGVSLFCQAGAWAAASEAALRTGRLDLVDTVILPALKQAAEVALDDCKIRAQSFKDTTSRLRLCRAARAALSLSALAPGYESRIYAAFGASAIGGAGAADGEDVGHMGGENDGESVWSDASSVFSSASGYGGAVQAAWETGSLRSSGTAGSNMSAMSGKSGRFSNLSQSTFATPIANTRQTLRLAAADGTGSMMTGTELVQKQQQNAFKFAAEMDSKAQRKMQGGAMRRGNEKRGGRAGRHRPGSRDEEIALEAELRALIPSKGCVFRQETMALVAALVSNGLADLGLQLVDAYAAYMAAIAAEISDASMPLKRRDVEAEATREVARQLGLDVETVTQRMAKEPSTDDSKEKGLLPDPVDTLGSTAVQELLQKPLLFDAAF